MNDARFKQLLNLYLDHELTSDQASELESEVLRNPARRQLYRDYCRLQRGCGLLFERTCSTAPASFALARALNDAERKVAGTGGIDRGAWWGYASAATVAACVAFVVFRSDGPGLGAPSMQAESDGSGQAIAAAPSRNEVAHPANTLASVVAPVAPLGSLEREPAIMAPRPSLMAPTLVLATLGSASDFDDVQRQRGAAQRWIEEEALVQAQRAAMAEAEYFEYRQPSSEPSGFQTRSLSPLGYRPELTSYQFQR